MAPPVQTTKLRLLKVLLDLQSTQPQTTVSFMELAQTIGVTPQRIGQLYRELAVEHVLPPVKKLFLAASAYPSSQSTKMRLLKLLQDFLRNQPDTPVSLSELAQTLGVSRERVHQLYRQLAVEHVLPPIRKRKKTRREKPPQPTSPKTLAFEAEVRAYIALGMNATEIRRITGRGANTVLAALHRLGVPLRKRSHKSG